MAPTATHRTTFIQTSYLAVGDQLSVFAAGHAYGRKRPEEAVTVSCPPAVVAAIADDWLRFEPTSSDGDRLGAFLVAIELPSDRPPSLELPELPTLDVPGPGAYLPLPSRSGFAANAKDLESFFESHLRVLVVYRGRGFDLGARA